MVDGVTYRAMIVSVGNPRMKRTTGFTIMM